MCVAFFVNASFINLRRANKIGVDDELDFDLKAHFQGQKGHHGEIGHFRFVANF